MLPQGLLIRMSLTKIVEKQRNYKMNVVESRISGLKPRIQYFSCPSTQRGSVYLNYSRPIIMCDMWSMEKFEFPGLEPSLLLRHNGRDGVSNHQPHDCLLNLPFRRRSKKTPKLRVTGLCGGNSPETGEFPAQRASNAENVSIWWRHHVLHVCPGITNVWFNVQLSKWICRWYRNNFKRWKVAVGFTYAQYLNGCV